ncbi:unnamed protein product [Arctogadus glacialis]
MNSNASADSKPARHVALLCDTPAVRTEAYSSCTGQVEFNPTKPACPGTAARAHDLASQGNRHDDIISPANEGRAPFGRR